MKLQDALRKVIRQLGVGIIQEKRLMSFLADYKAFDDYPAVKEVMRAIATGEYGKELCRLATEESDDDYLRFAESLKETLVRERSFKRELADYAVDSISLAIGVDSRVTVTELDDHGYEAVQRNAVGQGSSGTLGNRSAEGSGTASGGTADRQPSSVQEDRGIVTGSPADRKEPSPGQRNSRTDRVISGNSWETAPNGADSHCRFYRGMDLTSAFERL